MLELGVGAQLLRAAEWVLLALFIAALAAAIYFPRTLRRKALWTTGLLLVVLVPYAPLVYRTIEFRYQQAEARELFAERCRTAGVSIHRRVHGVAGAA